MYILFGLISTIITILMDYLILLKDISFHSYKLWSIIPIGGLAEGALCGLGIFLYVKRKNIKASAKHFIASGLIAFIGFGAITYFTYTSTYIDNGKINNYFKGEHISNTANLGKEFTGISFAINSLGFLIGGLAVGLIVLRNEVYCDKCKKGMNQNYLYKFDFSEFDSELKGLSDSLISKESFEQYIKSGHAMGEIFDRYFDVVFICCPICKGGFMKFRYMEYHKDSKGNIREREVKRNNRRLELEPNVISMIIQSDYVTTV